MNYKNRKWAALLTSALIICTLSGCGSTGNSSSNTSNADSSASDQDQSIAYLDTTDMFTDRDKEIGYDSESTITITLNDSNSTASASSVKIEGDVITITEEGTYLLSGSLSNGQITVDAASHTLSGKDSVRIAGGTLSLTAGKDGIHSENTDTEDK